MIVLPLAFFMLAQAYAPPRTPDGKPDLQGFWQARNTANWDIQSHNGAYKIPAGLGVVEGDAIPYVPSALAKRQENFKNREKLDPVEKCNLAGIPRTMYMPFPVQILQSPEAMTVLSEYVNTWRYVPMTGLPRYDGYESWNGDPRGHWEGNTLVVETVGFNDQTWFDHSGNFHSDALKVVERYTRTAPDTLDYEVTIEDSKVFTRPWKMKMPLYRVQGMTRLLENECYLDAEEAGKQSK